MSVMTAYPSLKLLPTLGWGQGASLVRACGPRAGAAEGKRRSARLCVPGLVGYARLCPGDQYEVWPPSRVSPQGSPPGLGGWELLGTRVPAGFVPIPTWLEGRAPWQVGRPPGADLSLLGPCPQVLMRLGRQRWRLKGRIESDDSQTWEEEEKAFIPTLHENLEIKVGGA